MSDRASIPASDPPITSSEADRLGRGEIVARLYRLLTTAPPEWPVRVALLGAWGEGKTSVANLVAASAVRDRHVVVTYPVSSVTGVEDLWLGFGQALCRAIDTIQLLQPHELPFRRLELATGLRRRPWLGSGAANAVGAAVALKFPTWAATARSTVAGLFSWLARSAGIGPTAMTKIRSKLGPDRRVIVILDDLDRADPRVVPELLLRLRDLLELPQFSFLVPFDRGVVARTLTAHHPAWENPDRFLEKIFDYQIDLPEPASSARLRMIEGEIKEHCPFIPPELPTRLRDTLPPSPRKLKSLIRHLYLYHDEAARHDEGEIDWWTVLCFEVLRQVSPKWRVEAARQLVHWLAVVKSDRDEVGFDDPRTRFYLGDPDQSKIADAFRKQLFGEDGLKVEEDQSADRVITLWINLLEDKRALSVDYNIELLNTSALVSAAEWRELFEQWQKEQNSEPILKWIDEQAVVKAVSSAEASAAVANRALEHRRILLTYMASRPFARDLSAPADEAIAILKLVEHLLPKVDSSADGRESLDRILSLQIAEWFHFDRNPADRTLRDHEAGLLKRLISNTDEQVERLLRAIEEARWDETAHKPWCELKRGLFVEARPILVLRLRDQFQADEGWRDLAPLDALSMVKELVLGEDSPLWTRGDPLSLWPLLQREDGPAQIAENSLALLRTCAAFLGRSGADEQLARTFLAYEDRVEALWKAAMSHRWQFRRLHDCRELRRRLIEANGALEPVLPEPSWLREGEPEDPS